MKTNELIGAALDWAVAKCEGSTDFWFDTVGTHWIKLHGQDRALGHGWAQSYLPSTGWAQGGPIIEREKIGLTYSDSIPCWYATSQQGKRFLRLGDTPLIAAMRCYVASKMGDTIDVPEELK